MPNKYEVSKRAAKQIEGILEHSYLNFGLDQALKYKTGIERSFQLLADNPEMGRKCDEVRNGYHRHEFERHIIFYRKSKNGVLITAVIYDGMNIQRFFDTKGNA